VLAALTVQTQTIMPLSMRADGLAPAAYGVVVALGAALIVVGQLFVPRLIDGRSKHTVLAAAVGLMASVSARWPSPTGCRSTSGPRSSGGRLDAGGAAQRWPLRAGRPPRRAT
jgi:hypothetical protein